MASGPVFPPWERFCLDGFWPLVPSFPLFINGRRFGIRMEVRSFWERFCLDGFWLLVPSFPPSLMGDVKEF